MAGNQWILLEFLFLRVAFLMGAKSLTKSAMIAKNLSNSSLADRVVFTNKSLSFIVVERRRYAVQVSSVARLQ